MIKYKIHKYKKVEEKKKTPVILLSFSSRKLQLEISLITFDTLALAIIKS